MVRSPRRVHSVPMTVTEERPPIDPPPAPGEPPDADGLHRSTGRRLVAGVAGGIADRFDVDVTIVRVAFVVAACFWGLGVVVYLAMWALVPPDHGGGTHPDGTGPADAPEGPAGPPWLTYVLLTGALFIGLVVSSAWWGGPRWGGGLGLVWLVVLFGVVVAALRRPTPVPSFRRFLLVATLVLVSVVILLIAAFFGAVATTGVPLTGGIGDRVVQPTAVAQLQPVYRLAGGTMTIDLTHVTFGPGPRTVVASVGVGRLVVEVPPGAVVDVNAHSAIGSVTYGSTGPVAVPTPSGPATAPRGPSGPRLTVDAQVGIGQVELDRGAP